MSITLYVITKPYPIVEQFEEESTYNDPKSKKRLKFPSISEAESLNLSVIVPAYNEEKRCKLLLCLVGILRTNLASKICCTKEEEHLSCRACVVWYVKTFLRRGPVYARLLVMAMMIVMNLHYL